MTKLAISQNRDADKLLSNSPLALLIGLVLDQQITLEKAFTAPLLLSQRLGEKLDAKNIASLDPVRLEQIFAAKPALHRYPASMAKRVQEVCTVIATDYGNNTSQLWQNAKDGKELYGRIKKLPGFGDMKARIFVALLGKQLGVDIPGWREVSQPFGEPGTFRSLADITDPDSLLKVREFKAEMKAKTVK
ncbi:MAG: Fe-S cluster assembly protein HesB [Acidimicrobiaceae bacterium]|nr:Fe-S cluster assembly protein HesB [Acidimicrobiaceae bacterium]